MKMVKKTIKTPKDIAVRSEQLSLLKKLLYHQPKLPWNKVSMEDRFCVIREMASVRSLFWERVYEHIADTEGDACNRDNNVEVNRHTITYEIEEENNK